MRSFLTFCLYLALLLVSLGAAALGVMNYLARTRGVESGLPTRALVWGTNVALERYASDADLDRALELVKRAGLTHVRQYFPWRAIEPTRGAYAWAAWDRIVPRVRAHDLNIVAVLHTAPAWAQRAYERDLPTAPPDDFNEFARFASAFAERYGGAIDHYQIWDEPNVPPTWGRRNADPVEYAQLLIPAAQAIRARDPHAQILLAGLAMNLQLKRPHPDYSEILYLRGLYEIGAQSYFDIVAAKPYGMWTGPDDRQVTSSVLNFSRLILLRDEMRHYGDAARPLWAVELGWNALPAEWNGAPSPWGTDAETIQAERLVRALTRIQNEWQWVTGLFPLYLQPNAPPHDPRWGFALVNPDFSTRASFTALAQFRANPPPPAPPPAAPWLPVILLIGVALGSAARAWHYAFRLRVDERWRARAARFHALPELTQLVVLGIVVASFYYSPLAALNFVLLALLVILFALRLDLGLAFVIFTVPFWNYPKTLFGGFQLSMGEALTWVGAAAWFLDNIFSRKILNEPFKIFLEKIYRSLSVLDWLVVAFVILGIVSTRVAGNFGVASREFRLVVLDPALLYALVRAANLSSIQVRRLIYALLLSGVAVCAIGLAQLATGDVIVVDGVRRIRAVWGSPNNVALFLERVLPIALALTLWLPRARARWVFAGLTVLYAVTIYLTFSRGAFFLGVPAAVLLLALIWLTRRGLTRQARIAIAVALVVGIAALLPLIGTARIGSFLQEGTGTGFFRIAVWTSAVQMIREHPLFGVGLDNFLYEYPKYILPQAWREPNLSHPHNILLDFWVRLGVLGVLILAGMLIAFFRRAWRVFTTSDAAYTRALAVGLLASMAALLAHGLIDAAYFYDDLAYVFMLTLAVAQLIEREIV